MVYLSHEWNFGVPAFTSYTTVTPHSNSQSDFSAYVTSHIQYTIIACIERATVLWANIMHISHKYKAGGGMLSYSQLTNWCLGPPLRVKLFKKSQNFEL